MEAPRGNLRAVALIAGDNNVRGCLQFVQDISGTTHVTGKISGLSPGFHGFHIHSFGDTTNGCISTGLFVINFSSAEFELLSDGLFFFGSLCYLQVLTVSLK
jgi:Cu/Zn superoxide dismutase